MASPIRAAAGLFQQLRQTPRKMALKPFTLAAANKPATIPIDLGVTVHRIFLRFLIAGVEATEAEAKAQVTLIEAKIDGDAKISIPLIDYLAISNHANEKNLGTNYGDGTVCIHLARPSDQEISGQDGPAWGLAVDGPTPVKNSSLSVTLGTGATIDDVQAWMEVTAPTPLGRHTCIRSISDTWGVAGDLKIRDWPFAEIETAIYAMHLNKQGGLGQLITTVGLKVDRNDEIDLAPYASLKAMFRAGGLTQQTGYTHIPFDRRGRPMEALPVAFQQAELLLRTSASIGNWTLWIETQEGVDPVQAPVPVAA